MPRRTGPPLLQRRQLRRRIPHPPRRTHPLAALLPAPDAPPEGDLRPAASRKGALPAHLARNRRLGRYGPRRLDRRLHPARNRGAGRRPPGPRESANPRPAVRPAGPRAGHGRPRPRRPETREYHRRRRRHALPDRLRRLVPARLRRGDQPRTGHGGLPAPGPHGGRLRRTDRRLPRGADLDGAARAGRGPYALGPLRKLRRIAVHAPADRLRPGLPGDARAVRKTRHGRSVPHRATAHGTHPAALRTCGAARRSGPGETRRPERDGGRNARTLRRKRTLGLPHGGAGRRRAALRQRVRLHRGAGRRSARRHVALHRHGGPHAPKLPGLCGGEAVPRRKGAGRAQRRTAGDRTSAENAPIPARQGSGKSGIKNRFRAKSAPAGTPLRPAQTRPGTVPAGRKDEFPKRVHAI